MSKLQDQRRQQKRLARLEIVADLYKMGWSYNQIVAEVRARLDLPNYRKQYVSKDVKYLLEEWKKDRITDVDSLVQLELERIDKTCQELWSQWLKSKEDWQRTTNTKRGKPQRPNDTNEDDNDKKASTIRTTALEESKTNQLGLGDPRYIAEIRAQLAERRKLLGLYAPEKRDITTGGRSFAEYLVQSGLIEPAADDVETTKD